MRILYASDIHVSRRHFHDFLRAVEGCGVDAAMVGGDLVPVRGSSVSETMRFQETWVRETFLPGLADFHGRFPRIRFYLDLGNDDFASLRPLIEEGAGKGLSLIHARVRALDDQMAVAGYMCVPPTPFRIKDWEKCDTREDPGVDRHTRRDGFRTGGGIERAYRLNPSNGTIEEDLDLLSRRLKEPAWRDRPFLFVAHSPPRSTSLDCLHDGRHVGSLAIRRFIEQWATTGRLRAAFHGHIHESPRVSATVYDRIGGILCFNAGQSEACLRALLFDTRDIPGSARLVIGEDREGRIRICPLDGLS